MLFTTASAVLSAVWNDVRFIGMNTSHGFRFISGGLPEEKVLKRTYIIKGGPGTGKSTLMMKVADHFETKGLKVTRYLCSSDPDSFDAILIDGKVCVVDGTAPHVKEMKYPGACSEAVCLSNFWSRDVLTAHRDEIVHLTDEKTRLFSKAYGYIKAENTLFCDALAEAEMFYLKDKAQATADSIASSFKEKGISVSEYPVRSIGMKGPVRLDVFEKRAKKTVHVKDCYCAGYLFLNDLITALNKRNVGYMFSVDPLRSEKVVDVFIPGHEVLFSIDENGQSDKTINAERFIEKNKLKLSRGQIRLSLKCVRELETETEKLMGEIANMHFRLEELYGSAMNFDAICEYTKLLIRDIDSYLR